MLNRHEFDIMLKTIFINISLSYTRKLSWCIDFLW